MRQATRISRRRGTAPITYHVPPNITSVVVAEADTPKNGTIESNEDLIITWVARSGGGIFLTARWNFCLVVGITVQTLTLDGKVFPSIKGPYGGLYILV